MPGPDDLFSFNAGFRQVQRIAREAQLLRMRKIFVAATIAVASIASAAIACLEAASRGHAYFIPVIAALLTALLRPIARDLWTAMKLAMRR